MMLYRPLLLVSLPGLLGFSSPLRQVYLLFVPLMEVLVLCRLRHQVRRLIGEHDPFIVSPFFTGDPYIAVLVDLVCIE